MNLLKVRTIGEHMIDLGELKKLMSSSVDDQILLSAEEEQLDKEPTPIFRQHGNQHGSSPGGSTTSPHL